MSVVRLLLTIGLLIGTSRCLLPTLLLDALRHFLAALPPPTTTTSTTTDSDLVAEEYDFVIVGAGSGGSVLANRLTEDPRWRVLLLEAGKDEIFLTDVPLAATVVHVTDYNWAYATEPGPYCLSTTNARCKWARGKAVGGTSVINFMIHSRGSPRDYDDWAARGNPGWSYREVLPYFKKSENARLRHEDVSYHGHGGYLDVTTSPYVSPLREPFLRAGTELGYDVIDYDGARTIGISTVHVNMRRGRRVSASKAFLRPIRDRANFHLSKLSRVTRIAIDPETRAARQVEFLKNGRKYVVRARKEILLCAGSVNSAQLLMLAGVGPKDHLESLGIDVLEDLPVGLNLQDHVSMQGLTFLVNESVTLVEPRLILNPLNTIDYFVKGTGPLTSPAGAEVIAFVNTKGNRLKGVDKRSPDYLSKVSKTRGMSKPGYSPATSANDYPDIELVFGVSGLTGDISGGYRTLIGLKDELYEEMYGRYKGLDSFSIVPVLLRPRSRGRVSLRSKDPLDSPVLEANYFEDEEDLRTMVRGIRKALEFAATSALRRYNATLIPRRFSGCEDRAIDSDEYWSCASRRMTSTLSHLAGTCRMGPRSGPDRAGVVDHRLRVHGIRRLRVVDASVMPTIVAGHTNAPVYMIAEKAADMIKEDWRDETRVP